MPIVPILILFPVVVALILLLSKNVRLSSWVCYVGAAVIAGVTGLLVVASIAEGFMPLSLFVETKQIDMAILISELLITVGVTYLCFKHKKYWVSLLSILPTVLMTYTELNAPHEELYHIYIDRLSILMCMIVGIVGSLIIVYAVGYMAGYHITHTEVKDRRNVFFALLFLFMGAMYGFVLSSNLIWLYFFWECTSVCSFLLIGYTRSEEAVTNSFRALWMNLLGGAALSVGIAYFAFARGSLSFDNFVQLGVMGDPVAMVCNALMAFAALTKAAQLPFSTWLLGAMVAPTPSSALLHSATMVKAGIYVLLRLSPAMSGKTLGAMISFIGGFTFLVASIMAIAQSDGKRVLAMSTVSNLGLMVACSGIGTPETVWAGVFLMIFHAVSKSLLFLDIGATENAIHSRDVEDMHGMLYFLPKLAIFMFIGIAGMFLAPFGMLISKWAALRAAVDENNILILLFIVFGSSTTSFYWSKWMGKLISHPHAEYSHVRDLTRKNEMLSLTVHAILMVLLCALFPLLSRVYVNPMLNDIFGKNGEVLSQTLLYMLVAIIIFVFLVPPVSYFFSSRFATNRKLSYMGGINIGDDCAFVDSFGESKRLWLSNYYFANRIGIRKMMIPCQFLTTGVLIIMFCSILGEIL